MLSYGNGLQENLMNHGIGGLRLQHLGLLNSGVVVLWMTVEELLGLIRRSVESR